MKYIQAANEAIHNAGGNHALAGKLAKKTGLSEAKLYARIRAWRINGVSIQFIRTVSKFGNVPMTRLIP